MDTIPEKRETGDKLVSAAELADRWGVCRATIYNSLPRGLPSVRIGRARRFRVAEADRWLDAQADRVPAA